MGINWKVRAKNKLFWVALIPALALLAQTVAALFGFEIDLADFQGKALAVVDALFVVLVIVGVVVDPTTNGIDDSKQVMTYDEPKKSE